MRDRRSCPCKQKLVFLTDIEGVYKDNPMDPDNTDLRADNVHEAEKLISEAAM